MTKRRLLTFILGLVLIGTIAFLAFSLYHKSRPQTKYLTPPKTSVKQIKARADLIIEGKVLRQEAKQLKVKKVTYTAYRVKVIKVIRGEQKAGRLTIYKAGFRDPKSGDYVLYRNDSLPLVNHHYRFYLTKVANNYLANSPHTMLALPNN